MYFNVNFSLWQKHAFKLHEGINLKNLDANVNGLGHVRQFAYLSIQRVEAHKTEPVLSVINILQF